MLQPIKRYTAHSVPLGAQPTEPLIPLDRWFLMQSGEWVKVVQRDWFESTLHPDISGWMLLLEVHTEMVWIIRGKRIKAHNPIRAGVWERQLLQQIVEAEIIAQPDAAPLVA